jgi:hypothetical protein
MPPSKTCQLAGNSYSQLRNPEAKVTSGGCKLISFLAQMPEHMVRYVPLTQSAR